MVKSGRYFHGIDTWETTLESVVDVVGEDVLLFATDWPHGDTAWPTGVDQVMEWPGAFGKRQAEYPGGERDEALPPFEGLGLATGFNREVVGYNCRAPLWARQVTLEYRDSLGLLMGLVDFERFRGPRGPRVKFDLGRMEALLKRLGDPHLAVPSVHVAGTKGKGSTTAMVSSVLTQQGYKTGTFTSPHLHTSVSVSA